MEHNSLRQHRHTRIVLCWIGTFLQHKQSGSFGLCQKHSSLHQHRHTRIDQCLLDRFPQHKLSGWPGRMLERNIRQWIQDTPLTVQNQCLDCMFQQHKQSGSFGLCQKHSSLHQQHHRMFDQMMLDSNLDCMQSHSSDQQMTQYILPERQYTTLEPVVLLNVPAAQAVWLVWAVPET